MTRFALLYMLAACNELYGLDETELAPAVDADGDSVRDVDDNCPLIANPSQRDDDGDTLGDACDNCPLIPNTGQETSGDDDGVGDHCDPHPVAAGDCLVLLDTFTDPDAFSAGWQVIKTDAANRVEPSAGEVALIPSPGTYGVAIVARDAMGALLTGPHDVQLIARGTIAMGVGGAAAVSNLSSVMDGYRCELRKVGTVEHFALALQQPNNEMSPGGQLSGRAVGERMVLRLVSQSSAGERILRCRGDYGVAIGASASSSPVTALPGGSPGVLAIYDPLRVDAIAIYRFAPGVACGDPIVR
jgi:hypothetical protein